MKANVRPMLIWLTLGVALFAACTNRKSKPIDVKAFAVLSDFVLVGTAPYDKNIDVNRIVPSHGFDLMLLPTHLEVDKAYIFHHRSPLDGEKLALSELPSRLRKQGMQIVQAPQSTRDLMLPYVGGPIFTIKFRDGDHSGLIFSQLCPNLTKQINEGWTGTDYVLVYTQ